ncbi:hypothetical protein SPV1_04303 [Mariprofundus ferrooxydans PV-1]|uniref:Protein CR006 P-loop domain-containing protein n=2 Tax=Mariprofundus ferrooxydans TaxID=314344 RepID=Q0F3D0_9PROT|nr:hypothetical protein SPV1_04303 [Mariprofundus ferrooxydans PV-1]
MVYNRDFVESNFDQSSELKGVFTLGESDMSLLQQIDDAKAEKDSLTAEILRLKRTLEGNDGEGGKRAELAALEQRFQEVCWRLKNSFDEHFQGAFQGVRNSKERFTARLMSEAETNTASAQALEYLRQKASSVFGETPSPEGEIDPPSSDVLLAYESNPILGRVVVGKSDVDIAAMIERLGNSDWVRQGRSFFDINDGHCPFCQRETEETFAASLESYFDEAYENDLQSIQQLYDDYLTESTRIQQKLLEIMSSPSRFLNVNLLEAEVELLKSKVEVNLQRIREKKNESRQRIELESLSNIINKINSLLAAANTAILEHNQMVSNLEQERSKLTTEVWKYLLDNEISHDLSDYQRNKTALRRAIDSLVSQVQSKTNDIRTKEQEIRTLERNMTSIQPTIDSINALLASFGFHGFSLAPSDQERFYKLVRADGTDAKESLSEGEKTFITFLYFYHLLKGSESESGMTTDRIVVFDDPISSLDSDILFVVSSLIKGLLDEVASGAGHIKQVFVFTHNVYFHKEVSYNRNRRGGLMSHESFWTVRKRNSESAIQRHNSNPIKTSYELLWADVRDREHRSNHSMQNTLRRVLENYFTITGGVDRDEICSYFEGRERLLCNSLFSWVNDGSHFATDDIYTACDDSMIDAYLDVFKKVFERAGHGAHYRMMMGSDYVENVPTSTHHPESGAHPS